MWGQTAVFVDFAQGLYEQLQVLYSRTRMMFEKPTPAPTKKVNDKSRSV